METKKPTTLKVICMITIGYFCLSLMMYSNPIMWIFFGSSDFNFFAEIIIPILFIFSALLIFRLKKWGLYLFSLLCLYQIINGPVMSVIRYRSYVSKGITIDGHAPSVWGGISILYISFIIAPLIYLWWNRKLFTY